MLYDKIQWDNVSIFDKTLTVIGVQFGDRSKSGLQRGWVGFLDHVIAGAQILKFQFSFIPS